MQAPMQQPMQPQTQPQTQPQPQQYAEQAPPPAPTTAPTTTPDMAQTVARRVELDVLYVSRWQLDTPEQVAQKRMEVMHHFSITPRPSPYRLRAFNTLSAWMDSAFEQHVWSDAFLNLGVAAMESLRSVAFQEDDGISAHALYAAMNVQPGNLPDVVSLNLKTRTFIRHNIIQQFFVLSF